MTFLNLSFQHTPEIEQQIIDGYKCCLTWQIHQRVGDTFSVRDRLYRICDVQKITYDEFLERYAANGFYSREDADSYWKLHQLAKFEEVIDLTTDEVTLKYSGGDLYAHYFAYVGQREAA